MDESKATLLIREEYYVLIRGELGFRSLDVGASAIGRQYAEVKAEIDTPSSTFPQDVLRAEVVKLAAMALRFLIDLC